MVGGKRYFEVYLGKKYTGGPIIRKKHPTLAEAREWLNGPEAVEKKANTGGLVSLVERAGRAVFELSPAQVNEAVAAFKALAAVNLSLTEAVKLAILHARPPQGAQPLSAAIEHLCKVKRNAKKNEKYVKGLEWSLGRFATDFKNCAVHEISRGAVESWLEEEDFTPATQRNYIRDLFMLFRFAIDRGWSSVNPIIGIEKPGQVKPEVVPLQPDQVVQLLAAAKEKGEIPLLLGIAIKAFAGLRTSELLKLDWQQVKQRQITVLSVHAKTRKRRVVTIQESLQQWLAPYRRAEGLVVGYSARGWHERVADLAEKAKVAPLPQNVLRKSFCSYHLAHFRNENLTASEAGNSPQVIYDNYRNLIDDEQATAAYWSVVPSVT